MYICLSDVCSTEMRAVLHGSVAGLVNFYLYVPVPRGEMPYHVVILISRQKVYQAIYPGNVVYLLK